MSHLVEVDVCPTGWTSDPLFRPGEVSVNILIDLSRKQQRGYSRGREPSIVWPYLSSSTGMPS